MSGGMQALGHDGPAGAVDGHLLTVGIGHGDGLDGGRCGGHVAQFRLKSLAIPHGHLYLVLSVVKRTDIAGCALSVDGGVEIAVHIHVVAADLHIVLAE